MQYTTGEARFLNFINKVTIYILSNEVIGDKNESELNTSFINTNLGFAIEKMRELKLEEMKIELDNLNIDKTQAPIFKEGFFIDNLPMVILEDLISAQQELKSSRYIKYNN